MATVTGLTAARMAAIEAASVIKGAVLLDNLILEKFDGSKIDAGSVRGPQGIIGPAGDVSNAGLRRGLFSAYRGTALSIAQNTYVAIPMDVEEYDLNGWHVPGGFNPQLAGYYRLNVSISVAMIVASGTRLIAMLFKNGIYHKAFGSFYTVGTSVNILSGTAIVQANGTTDYFQAGLHQNAAAAMDVEVSSSRTYFQGELIAPTV